MPPMIHYCPHIVYDENEYDRTGMDFALELLDEHDIKFYSIYGDYSCEDDIDREDGYGNRYYGSNHSYESDYEPELHTVQNSNFFLTANEITILVSEENDHNSYSQHPHSTLIEGDYTQRYLEHVDRVFTKTVLAKKYRKT